MRQAPIYHPYPKYVFKGSEKRLVKNEEEEKELGRGWDDKGHAKRCAEQEKSK